MARRQEKSSGKRFSDSQQKQVRDKPEKRQEKGEKQAQSKKLAQGKKQAKQAAQKTAKNTSIALPISNSVKSLAELDALFQEYRATRKSQEQQKGPAKLWQEWGTFLIQTACTMLAVYLLLTFVIGITVVHGDSMQPALHESDIALIWRLSGGYGEGDVVVLYSEGASETLIKRIIAGPGDTVEIMDETGQVMVNDVLLAEPYIYVETHSRGENSGPVILGENEYFVLGDNRISSLDSRSPEIGPVKKSDILGKVVFFFRPGEV